MSKGRGKIRQRKPQKLLLICVASGNAPERQSLRKRAASPWGGVVPNMTWCIQFPWYLLWPHNSKLRVTIRREREGTNRKPLKCNPTHAGHGPVLSFWKKQFLKQSYPLHGTAGGGTTSRERGKAAEPVMENPQSLSSPLITLTKIKRIWWNTAQLHPTLLRNWIWLLKSAPKPLLSKYWRFTSVNCIQTTPGQRKDGRD